MKLKEGDEVVDEVTGKVSKILKILTENGSPVAYEIEIDKNHQDRYPWEVTLLTRQATNRE